MKRIIFCIVLLFLIERTAYCANSVSETIGAEDTWTSWISPTYNNSKGNLNISVVFGDTGSGTVRLQRTFNSGVTIGTVKTYTASGENQLIDQELGVKYRIGIGTGDYISGTITVRLSN